MEIYMLIQAKRECIFLTKKKITMKNQLRCILFFMLLTSHLSWSQQVAVPVLPDGQRILNTSRMGTTNYEITLLPNQQFTGYWYYSTNGTTTKNGNFSMASAPSWLTGVSPANFSSSSCSDIVPVGFSFQAPSVPGVYTYTVFETNGNWNDMSITLTVTNTPDADTTRIVGNVFNTDTTFFDWSWNGFDMSCLTNYFPSTQLTFDYDLVPNVSWLNIQPSSATIDTSQTLRVNKVFQNNTAGTYYTLQVVETEWYSYPSFRYFEYVVQSTAQYSSIPDETWQITGAKPYVNSTISGYTDSDGKGSAKIVYSNNNNTNTLKKPLIFVEPFEFPTQDFDLAELIDRLQPGDLGAELDLDSYDLVFLEFDKNHDFLQRNAFVLQQLIDTINGISGVDSLVVVGLSMGGVIARYALADMEANSQAHRVRLMATIDSPHRGANIPLSFQYLVEELKSLQIPFTNKSLLDVLKLPNVNFTLNSTNLVDILNLAQSPASQQLLIEQADYPIPTNALHTTVYHNDTKVTLHDTFQQEYQNLGMPQHCRNIALSKGAFCNELQNSPFSGSIVNYSYSVDLMNLVGLGPVDISGILNSFTSISSWLGVSLTKFNFNIQFSLKPTPENFATDICKIKVELRPVTNKGWADYIINNLVVNGNPNSSLYKLFNPIDFKVRAKNDLALYNLPGGHLNFGSVIPEFVFVPSFSALDVHPDSLEKNITPFDNFRKDSLTSNGQHVKLRHDEPAWLLSELRSTPNYINHCQPALPDLCLKNTSISNPVIDTNATVLVISLAFNTGTIIPAKDVTAHFYLSSDEIVDTADILLGIDTSVNYFFTNYIKVLSKTLQIPQTTTSGNWFILINLDNDNTVLEKYEHNNLKAIPIVVNGINPPLDTILPLSWEYTMTDTGHSVIIPADAFISIQGTQPQEGDYIGAFYQHNGSEYSAGYAEWAADGTVLTVYRNDTIPSLKNGYDDGDVFAFKWFSTLTGKSSTIYATYHLPSEDSTNIITHIDTFYSGGVSAIDSLYTIDTLWIPLAQNWNMISSNVEPFALNIEDVLKGIENNLILAKDRNGNVYTPDPIFSLNTIGNWSMSEGYSVKMYNDDTVMITGISILPELSPIALQQGWQIISYYPKSPIDASNVFSGIDLDIALVKDVLGNTYIPDYNINNIGQMHAGRGYKLKAKTNTTLLYPANVLDGKISPPPASNTILEPVHFANLPITGKNATIVLKADLANDFLNIGDEIGVFNSQGVLCGAAAYNGQNFAITVWGKENTADAYGMATHEEYEFKVWYKKQNLETSLYGVGYEVGDGEFFKDKLSVISEFEVKTPTTNTDFIAGFNEIVCFPNPATKQINFRLDLASTQSVTLLITDVQGRQYTIIENKSLSTGQHNIPVGLEQFAAGVYFYQVMTAGEIYTERFTVVK